MWRSREAEKGGSKSVALSLKRPTQRQFTCPGLAPRGSISSPSAPPGPFLKSLRLKKGREGTRPHTTLPKRRERLEHVFERM